LKPLGGRTVSNEPRKKGKGLWVVLGSAAAIGLGALIFRSKPAEAAGRPAVGMKWGDNGDTGPQTIVYGTTQLLKLTASNPTAKEWTYDIQFKCNGEIGASWKQVTIPAGGSITLPWEVIFGPYQPGDANLNGSVDVSDITAIGRMLLRDGDPPNIAADANLDGSVDSSDQNAISDIILGYANLPPVNSGMVPDAAATYSTSVHVREVTTGKTWDIPGDEITIHQPAPPVGWINIQSNPSGANITIDGESKGSSPLSVEVALGSHIIGATLDGYVEPPTQNITVVSENTQDNPLIVSFALTPIKGVLIATCNVLAHIEAKDLNGNVVNSGWNGANIELDPGTYTVSAHHEGYTAPEQQVEISSGVTSYLDFYLEFIVVTGSLVVDSNEYEKLTVIINGETQIPSVREFQLMPGTYVIGAVPIVGQVTPADQTVEIVRGERKYVYFGFNSILEARFTAVPSGGPAPLTVRFTSESIYAGRYEWDFGDGGTSFLSYVDHTFTHEGTYTVTLTVWTQDNMAIHWISKEIVVTPEPVIEPDINVPLEWPNVVEPVLPPVADFTISPDSGVEPLTVQFNDVSTGDVRSRFWDFGDGVTHNGKSPSHTFQYAGVYTVILRVEGLNGSDEISKTVTVLPVGGKTEHVLTAPTPTGGEVKLVYYGDNVSSDVLFAEMANNGKFSYIYVDRTPDPTRIFDYRGSGSVAQPTIVLYGETITFGLRVQQYSWYYAEVAGPVTEAPISDFIAIPSAALTGESIGFVNNSMNADTYLWDFGDGHTSNEIHPTHSYNEPDHYTVSLTASNSENGLSDTYAMLIAVTGIPRAVDFYPTSIVALQGNITQGSAARLKLTDNQYVWIEATINQAGYYCVDWVSYIFLPYTNINRISLAYNLKMSTLKDVEFSLYNFATSSWVAIGYHQVGPGGIARSDLLSDTDPNISHYISPSGEIRTRLYSRSASGFTEYIDRLGVTVDYY
jgi:PKD repeat protein